MVVIYSPSNFGILARNWQKKGVLTMIDAGMNHLYPIVKENMFGFVQKWWSYPHVVDII